MNGMDPGRLRWRLLAGNLVVGAAGAGAVALAVAVAAPRTFDFWMEHMGMPGGMSGMMGGSADPNLSAAFGDAIGSALVIGIVAAALAAAVVAYLISARLARPISELAEASVEVAAGRYERRVAEGSGELGELAASFNAMAASLEATERRRLELIGDVAHELRTPIASLSGYVEGLEAGVFKPEPTTWRVLGDATKRLATVVDDLSELWRAEAHEIVLAPENLDAATVVADALARHRSVAITRSIELTGTTTQPITLRADPARLAQVLDNLIGNALRYTAEGGSVRVAVAAKTGHATITINDTGPGLTQEQLGRVFDRFYRADPSRSRAAGGSGLGLAIAKALTDAMGGRIWAASEGPGRGATFGLEMPAA